MRARVGLGRALLVIATALVASEAQAVSLLFSPSTLSFSSGFANGASTQLSLTDLSDPSSSQASFELVLSGVVDNDCCAGFPDFVGFHQQLLGVSSSGVGPLAGAVVSHAGLPEAPSIDAGLYRHFLFNDPDNVLPVESLVWSATLQFTVPVSELPDSLAFESWFFGLDCSVDQGGACDGGVVAIETVQVDLVPEPGTGLLLVLACAASMSVAPRRALQPGRSRRTR